jgi:hypothetical protein
MSIPIPIPGPPGIPLLGNINDVDPAEAVVSLGQLADTYGLNPFNQLPEQYTDTLQALSSSSPSAGHRGSSSPHTN